ncbi:hypothetical protein AKO1_012708 [Acrasis kona]|uniref:DDE Tnp4 domain-containing protein n=1 Tax=Acrasis kona TaxID=1008807 RepID=A0AAW2YWM3_9EUKA
MNKTEKSNVIRATLLCAILFEISTIQDEEVYVNYPLFVEDAAKYSGKGLGRGKGIRKKRHIHHQRRSNYQYFTEFPSLFQKNTHLSQVQFDLIVEDIGDQREYVLKKTNILCLSYEDMVLLTLIWLVKYESYSSLSLMFGVSEYVISITINTMTEVLCAYFMRYIPNKQSSTTQSSLSSHILFVLDGTIHMRLRPQKSQHFWYNTHYEMHGMVTQLLVDFDGYIAAFETGFPGSMHDSTQANHSHTIRSAIGMNFALTDSAYSGLDFCVAGYKPSQLQEDPNRVEFDRISRREQKIVEHINGFFKKCRTVSKKKAFEHSVPLHIRCVGMACGLYNFRKACGEFSVKKSEM